MPRINNIGSDQADPSYPGRTSDRAESEQESLSSLPNICVWDLLKSTTTLDRNVLKSSARVKTQGGVKLDFSCSVMFILQQ